MPKTKFQEQQPQKLFPPQSSPRPDTALFSYAAAAPGNFPAPVQSMMITGSGSRYQPAVAAAVGSSSVQPPPPSVPQHLELGGTPTLASASSPSLQQQLLQFALLQHSQSAQAQAPAVRNLPTAPPASTTTTQQDLLQLQLQVAEQQVHQAQLQVQQQAQQIQQAVGFQLAMMLMQQQRQNQVQQQGQQQQSQPLLQQLSLLQQELSQRTVPVQPLPTVSLPVPQTTASVPQVHQQQQPSQLTGSNILTLQLELFNQALQQSSEQSTRSGRSSSLDADRSNSIPRYIDTEKRATPGRTNSPSSSASEERSSSDMLTGDSGSVGDNNSEDVVDSYTSANSLSPYAFSTYSDEYPNATTTPTSGNRNGATTTNMVDAVRRSSYSSLGVTTAKKGRSFGVCFSDTSSNNSSLQNYTVSDLGNDSVFESGNNTNGNTTEKSGGAREVSTYASSLPRSLAPSSSPSLHKRKRSRSKRKSSKKIRAR